MAQSPTYVGYKCSLCDWEHRQGYRLAVLAFRSHLSEKHPEIYEGLIKSKEDFEKEFNELTSSIEADLIKKYPLAKKTFLNYAEGIKPKPKRLWVCPDCGEKMPYGHYGKNYHYRNRGVCKKFKDAKREG